MKCLGKDKIEKKEEDDSADDRKNLTFDPRLPFPIDLKPV